MRSVVRSKVAEKRVIGTTGSYYGPPSNVSLVRQAELASTIGPRVLVTPDVERTRQALQADGFTKIRTYDAPQAPPEAPSTCSLS
jgi:hypothetical protein